MIPVVVGVVVDVPELLTRLQDASLGDIGAHPDQSRVCTIWVIGILGPPLLVAFK